MSSLPLRQTVRDASGTSRADAVTLNSADPGGGLQQISEEQFRNALAAEGEPVTRAYRIAGQSVRLRFAQDALARRLTRAFG
ncbi:MAG: hypothetical protein WCF27_08095, partial [Gaiellaceae bacterium]